MTAVATPEVGDGHQHAATYPMVRISIRGDPVSLPYSNNPYAVAMVMNQIVEGAGDIPPGSAPVWVESTRPITASTGIYGPRSGTYRQADLGETAIGEVPDGWLFVKYRPDLSYLAMEPTSEDSRLYAQYASIDPSCQLPQEDASLAFIPPNINDFRAHLNRFGEAISPSTAAMDGMRRAVRVLQEILGDIKIEGSWLDPINVFRVTVPINSSPGLEYRKRGFTTKKDALLAASIDAHAALNHLMRAEGIGMWRSVATIAGRGKIARTDGTRSNRAGRLILVTCLRQHLMGAIASSLATRGLTQWRRRTNSEGPALGVSPFGGSLARTLAAVERWRREQERRGLRTKVFSTDFKGFDQKIPRAVLEENILAIMSMFQDVPGSHLYWHNETENMIETVVAWFDGTLIKKRSGVASGNAWTSVVGTFVAFTVLKSVLTRLGVKSYVVTFGDDAFFAIAGNEVTRISVEVISENSTEMYGMPLGLEKSFEFGNVYGDVGENDDADYHNCPQFLSLFPLRNGCVAPATRDVVLNLLHPERGLHTPEWEMARAISAYVLSFHNGQLRDHIGGYIDWLKEKFPGVVLVALGLWKALPDFRDIGIPIHIVDELRDVPSAAEVASLHQSGSWRPQFTSREEWDGRVVSGEVMISQNAGS